MTTTQTGTSTWAIDPVHTSVEFGVKHLNVSTFKGRFKTVGGSIHLDEENPTNSSVNAEIESNSIDIVQERLFGHVISPDFLGAEQYPKLSFKSTGVQKVDDTHWKVSGDLTIRDATRPVVLDTQYLGQEVHPFSKKTVAAFLATTTIDRRDFGLTWNAVMDSGASYVGEQVTITLHIEAVKQ
jgi:polyisoprenoid-binding protein YceI